MGDMEPTLPAASASPERPPLPRRRHPALGARIATGVVSAAGLLGLTGAMAATHKSAEATTVSTSIATTGTSATSTSGSDTNTTTATSTSSSATAAAPSASANTSSHGS